MSKKPTKNPPEDTSRLEAIRKEVIYMQGWLQNHAESLEKIKDFSLENEGKEYVCDLVGAMLQERAKSVKDLLEELPLNMTMPELKTEAEENDEPKSMTWTEIVKLIGRVPPEKMPLFMDIVGSFLETGSEAGKEA